VSALGHWLKQLMILVLLAGLTDLLLPTQAMQRYVRTVMGLAVIAMMLQPIVPLFDRAWPERAAAVAVQELDKAQTQASGASVNAIVSAMADMQAQQTDALLAQRLKQEVEVQYGVQVTAVEVTGAAAGGTQTRIVIRLASGAGQTSRIRHAIAQELGIPESQVDIES
jgi:stage III sporulation protein AF